MSSWIWLLWTLAQAAAGDRPPLPASELKSLRESNIFSPYRAKGAERPTRREERRGESRVEVSKPKAAVLTGIVFDAVLPGHKGLIEDRNEERLRVLKEPKFVKVGDEVLGFRVEEIDANRVRIGLPDGTRKDLAVGDSLPAAEAAAANPESSAEGRAVPAVDPKPLDEAVKNDVLEQLKKRNRKKGRPQDDP